MARDQNVDYPNQPTNPPPTTTTSPLAHSTIRPMASHDNGDYQFTNTATESRSSGQGQGDNFVAPPRLTHLDLLIIENSGFPTLAEFEVFLQLYQKSYYEMEGAERRKLNQQLETLRRCMQHPLSIQAMVEAQQSIHRGHPHFSLKHWANFSRNGYILTSMISRCLNLTSFTLQRAVFEAALIANRNTITSKTPSISGKDCEDILSRGLQQWTAEDILKLETFVYIRGTEHQVNNPLSKATSPIYSSSSSRQPLAQCPDPARSLTADPDPVGLPSDLQGPWNYCQCLNYLTRRMSNFITSQDPELFNFTLPSNDQLQGMTADQRAECIRKHVIEQDAKRAALKSGNGLESAQAEPCERVSTGTQTSAEPRLIPNASTNSRGNCSLEEFSYDYQKHENQDADFNRSGYGSKYGPQSPWSSYADDGSEGPNWGDDSDSDWLPTQSGDWIPQKKSAKHVSFVTLATNIPPSLYGQKEDVVPLDIWDDSVARATSGIAAPPTSDGEGDHILAVDTLAGSTSHAQIVKRGNRKHSLTRGQRVARRGARRRGRGNDKVNDILQRCRLQLASQNKQLNVCIDALKMMSQGNFQSLEDPFTSCKKVPGRQDGQNVSQFSQENRTQLMLVEASKKEQMQMAHQKLDATQSVSPSLERVNPQIVPQDHGFENSPFYQKALMTIDQERKERLEIESREQDAMRAAYPSWEKVTQQVAPEGSDALQDYQKPIALVKQQNKERLEIEHQGQGIMRTAHLPSEGITQQISPNDVSQDQQKQSTLMEQQNKKQLDIACQEQKSVQPRANGQANPVDHRASLGSLDSHLSDPQKAFTSSVKEAQQTQLDQFKKLDLAIRGSTVKKAVTPAKFPRENKQTIFRSLRKFAEDFKITTPLPSDIAFINDGPLRLAIKKENLRRARLATAHKHRADGVSTDKALTTEDSATGTTSSNSAQLQSNEIDPADDEDNFMQFINNHIKDRKGVEIVIIPDEMD
ncbi:hypothetical protein OCU04_003550 [Sclerotinia nivalis]|uniref:Uncharacterized protein n=1 Tax=Sclerotinia nivalis TaxID=352851 RepID=A0A9X0AS56_9HELO|nr:hypothetical protein OCU04_003550 [Sclerotinia nivalis]